MGVVKMESKEERLRVLCSYCMLWVFWIFLTLHAAESGSTGVRCMALYGPTTRHLQCSLPNGTEQTLRFEALDNESGYCIPTNSSPGSCPCFTANRNATCPVAQCEEPETRLRHWCTFNVYLASRVGGRETKVLSKFDPTHNVVPPAPHSVTIQDGMVTWKSPAAVYLKKYNFQVDFRKLPDGKWQQSKKETSDLLSFVPINLKLMVRVRARPKDYEGFWSSWSPVVFSQETVPPGPSNDDTDWLFLHCILPLSVVCSFIASIALYFQRERIRHKIWPTIPDPKHWLERVLPTGNKVSNKIDTTK
uniref:Fibronectin type-III domain-containing protein n=1 Tax=Eptatretus burgeri TaxID=7764 RepID=A0A8C4R154_EPTBU